MGWESFGVVRFDLGPLLQLLQNVHGVDITHDNVCSSMLSCFFSYVVATVNRASYF